MKKSALVLLVLLPLQLPAALILDNLGSAQTSVDTVAGPTAILSEARFAYAFGVGSGTDWTVDSLTIDFDSTTTIATPIEVRIRGDFSGPGPGPILSTLTGPAQPDGILATYTPPTPLTLSASTSYVIEVIVPSGSGMYHVRTSDSASPATANALYFSTFKYASDVWFPVGDFPLLRLEATPVPEPAIGALLGFGTLILLRRSKPRANQQRRKVSGSRPPN